MAEPTKKRGVETMVGKPKIVEELTACCDGGLGALGHPRVYLPIGERDYVDCPYCGQRFMLHRAAAAPELSRS
ncbi:MAG: zinc-finger domain-containing protein [Gammaproteobacteria bacterium]